MRVWVVALLPCVLANVLCSILVFEGQDYVDHALNNLRQFTRASTKIIVHLSKVSSSRVQEIPGKLWLNPERVETCSGCGSVTRQHAANVVYAAYTLGLDFAHVAIFASTCRLFARGLEAHVARYEFSRVETPGWVSPVLAGCGTQNARNKNVLCDHETGKLKGWGDGWFDADALFVGGQGPRKAGFSTHEGSFYTRRAALAFAHWLLNETQLGDADVAFQTRVPKHKGIAVEEVLWPTYTLGQGATIGFNASAAGPSLCRHGAQMPTQGDVKTATSIVTMRLGRDRRQCVTPVMFKKWGAGLVAQALLDCLAAADARADDGDDAFEQRSDPTFFANDQRSVLRCVVEQRAVFLDATAPATIGVDLRRESERCALVRHVDSHAGPFNLGDRIISLAAAVHFWLADHDATYLDSDEWSLNARACGLDPNQNAPPAAAPDANDGHQRS